MEIHQVSNNSVCNRYQHVNSNIVADKDYVTAELAKYGVQLLNTPIPELGIFPFLFLYCGVMLALTKYLQVNQYQDLINLAEDAPTEITLDTILSISLDQSHVKPTTQPGL